MFSNIFSKFLLFFLLNNVLAIKQSDLYDVHQINQYKSNLTIHLLFDHYFENVPNNTDDVNNQLKAIMTSLVLKLNELNVIASAVEEHYWSNNFYKFLKSVEEHQIKIGYAGSFFELEKYIKEIERKRNTIDSAVRTISDLFDYSYFDNLVDSCRFLVTFLRPLLKDHNERSIVTVYQDFLRLLITKMATEDQYNFCGKSSSFRIGLITFYKLVMTPFLKKYAIVNYVRAIELKCFNQTAYPVYYDDIEENFISALQLTKKSLYDVVHYTYQCDVKYINQYNKDLYYYELEKMIQVIIVEERDISVSDSCSHNCDIAHTYVDFKHDECYQFRNCQYITNSYEICPSSNSSSRRYEWFKDKNGVKYGTSNYNKCSNKMKSVASYYNAAKIHDCDYCICSCVANPFDLKPQLAVISFREQISNISDGMVVVGVRFVKKNKMMHLQIKEGRLYPNGLISDSKWKELEDFHQDNVSHHLFVRVNKIHSNLLTAGIDYGFPDTINFDNIFAPENFVVTGARFRQIDPKASVSPIYLEILITKFDFFTGKLNSVSYWSSVKNTTREELIITDPDIPTKSPGNSIISKRNRFIRFQASDLKKDAGQSTIPFFDAQDVEGYPEFPLGGIGIFLRGRQGYGGFLAFRIFELKLEHHLKPQNS